MPVSGESVPSVATVTSTSNNVNISNILYNPNKLKVTIRGEEVVPNRSNVESSLEEESDLSNA